MSGWRQEGQTLHYTLWCRKCEKAYSDSVDLTKIIAKAAPQCPLCLQVLPLPEDLGERIFALQGKDKYGRKL